MTKTICLALIGALGFIHAHAQTTPANLLSAPVTVSVQDILILLPLFGTYCN